MVVKIDDEMSVEYDRSPEIKDAVFQAVIDYFLKMQLFHGEGIVQSDEAQIEAPLLMANIADNIIKFDVQWTV
jgi:hypothetical protein